MLAFRRHTVNSSAEDVPFLQPSYCPVKHTHRKPRTANVELHLSKLLEGTGS